MSDTAAFLNITSLESSDNGVVITMLHNTTNQAAEFIISVTSRLQMAIVDRVRTYRM